MKTTIANQTTANSNVARVSRAVDLYTAPQIASLHRRAGNTATADAILASLERTEAAGYRLCNILRDIKATCERTLLPQTVH
jgi:hypothetical protein